MTTFDPSTVRQAVAEFRPRRPQRFQELLPAREVIVELRQKRASYRSIAELLTQHCLPISKTAVAAFCHEVLGETVRAKRRPTRKRPPSIEPATEIGVPPPSPSESPSASATSTNADLAGNASDADVQPSRTRGPRIAQVRMLNSKPT